MNIDWRLGLMPDVGGTFMKAFEQGRAQRREREGMNALAAYAQNPNEQGLNALAQYDPGFVMAERSRMAQGQRQVQQDERAQLEKRLQIVGQAAQWADTPEKWDAAVDYLSEAYPDLAGYKGRFSPETRMAAIAAAGDIDGYMERMKPVNVGPGSHLVDPVTGQAKFSAPFAPRPVTVKEGETVVEYAPGGGSPDDVWRNMIHTESRGRQFGSNGQPLTSSAGAIGIAQVMPGTAPEAARLAGLPFDENRYRTDPAYNEALGRAYFDKMLADFGGDVPKAVAAYNAGPGRVRQAIQKGGENWAAHIPGETKGYLQSVLGPAGSRVIAQGPPKREKPPAAPSGYRWKPDGSLEPIPGGPQDKQKEQEAAYSQSAIDAFDRAIGSANRLLKHPGFNAGVGVPSINPLAGNLAGFIVPGSPAADFRAELDAMKAQVFLPMVQSMKGMGALSNAEGEKLTAAIGALDTKMSEGAFRASLNRIIGDLTTYRNRGMRQTAQPSRQAPARQQAPARNRPSVSNW